MHAILHYTLVRTLALTFEKCPQISLAGFLFPFFLARFVPYSSLQHTFKGPLAPSSLASSTSPSYCAELPLSPSYKVEEKRKSYFLEARLDCDGGIRQTFGQEKMLQNKKHFTSL